MEKIDYKKIFGEVFTPISLCEEMLNKLPEEVWKNPDLKWLDPACGSGNFLITVKQKLMKGLEKKIPDEIKREKHILNNMLYGVDIQLKNILLCILILDPNNKYSIKNHVVCADALEYDYWGGTKFNVVVGNPPYQEVNKNGTVKGTNLWSKFINFSIKNLISNSGSLLFVTPTTWMAPSTNKQSGDDLFNSVFMKYKLNYLNLDAKNYFNNIGSTFGWFHLILDKPCDSFSIEQNGVISKIKLTEKLPFLPTIVNSLSISIIQKILKNEYDKMNFITDRSIDKPEFLSKNNDKLHPYMTVQTINNILWSSTKAKDHNKSKIILSISGYPDIIKDDNGEYSVTKSYYMLTSGKKENKYIESLLSLNLYKWLLKYCKWSGFNHRFLLNSLPYPKNLNKNLTNNYIYDCFKLTKEEILFIESTLL